MIRSTAILIAMLSIGGVNLVYAQETTPGPGTVEVTYTPGGWIHFRNANSGPSFGNYSLGGALNYSINRMIGVEGEVFTSIGVSQDLQGGLNFIYKTPSTLSYTGNVVLSLPTNSSFVPYVTGGVGGLTMSTVPFLGVNSAETFLTRSVGGGLKWYGPDGRWGIRGDYRFMATQSKDTAPAFFGRDTEYGHRWYVGVLFNVIR